MKHLITGAGGFIASHLVEALLDRGEDVRVLVHYNSRGSWGHINQLDSIKRKNLEVHLGDITDPYLLQKLVAGCEAVYHLAALIGIPYSYHAPASYVTTNTVGTLNVLEACKQANVQRVIVTSTSEVYGTALYTPIDESHPLQAQSPYAASKIAADKLAQSYYCSFDLPIVVLRPFNTYGPRQSARAIIPTILSQAIAGATEIYLGNLEPKRDLTFVEDTAHAFLLAAETPGIEGEVIHFGQGSAISMGDLAHKCLEIVGSKAKIVSDPERQRPSKSEVDTLLADPSKAHRILGWKPQVALEEGLKRTAEYIRANSEKYRYKDYVV